MELTPNGVATDVGVTHGAKNNHGRLHGQVETESDRLTSPRRPQQDEPGKEHHVVGGVYPSGSQTGGSVATSLSSRTSGPRSSSSRGVGAMEPRTGKPPQGILGPGSPCRVPCQK